MITHNLGYPRIGNNREIKKACEGYWSGKVSFEQLIQAGVKLRQENWHLQKELGLDLIPSNDFSFYDHVLDMSLMLGAIPERFDHLKNISPEDEINLYFAMARGYQKNGLDITALEMTKWFDTNYHYLVPEFVPDQEFKLYSTKVIDHFLEAKSLGILTKPVLIGPVSYLLLGKEKRNSFDRLDLIERVLPVYLEIISLLASHGAEWIQIDEPWLAMDLNEKQRDVFEKVYAKIRKEFPDIKILIAIYFEGLRDNLALTARLPVNAVHLDLVRAPEQLETFLSEIPEKLSVSLGIVDGRNIWKNDFEKSTVLIRKAIAKIGEKRVMLAPSCSLLHSPCDLEMETDESTLPVQIKEWLAFARQKIGEIVTLKQLASEKNNGYLNQTRIIENKKAVLSRKNSKLIHNDSVRIRIKNIMEIESLTRNNYEVRKQKQQKKLNLPSYPSTTIGSFPQTGEVRRWRSELRQGILPAEKYKNLVRQEIAKAIRWQEETGLDVLVHGEFERNDMVEYFGEFLEGFAFTKNGWVQSYGSRCVKPPVIYGDIQRPNPVTVEWEKYAQSLTSKPIKGMLTGPVTILEWSFVRDDQPRSETCLQIALSIRDEVLDLEKANIPIIQIDEPALREGLPLRKADWKPYLAWAIRAFRLTYAGVRDETQIHTHMCYSEFNDIIQDISTLDADVITIESSRSQMELLDVFGDFKYPNDIGPGVYDIHSPRVPSESEIIELLSKAARVIPPERLWVNPDCGLKTRNWEETKNSIQNMVNAARSMRSMTNPEFS